MGGLISKNATIIIDNQSSAQKDWLSQSNRHQAVEKFNPDSCPDRNTWCHIFLSGFVFLSLSPNLLLYISCHNNRNHPMPLTINFLVAICLALTHTQFSPESLTFGQFCTMYSFSFCGNNGLVGNICFGCVCH